MKAAVDRGKHGGLMTTIGTVLRRVSSVTLAVAFVAMATSGLVMLLVDRFGLQLRMHPVHNVFGVIMVASGLLHAAFNWKTLVANLRLRRLMTLGILLASLMVLLLILGLTKAMDGEAIRRIEDILSAARQADH
jgi:hypothetical protein